MLHGKSEVNSDALRWVKTHEDIRQAIAQNVIAGIMALEGCEALGHDIEMIPLLYRLGIRMISLTWNGRTPFADGIAEEKTKGGLTTLGFRALGEMNRLGIIVDLSHLSQAGFWDVVSSTTHPVVASHTNCRALCDHPRNFTDRQIKALAQNGGVMGLVLFPGFVDLENPTITRAVDHVIHVAELVGIEHVGIGTDLVEKFLRDDLASSEGIGTPTSSDSQVCIEGCGRIRELSNLTAEMVRRGLSKKDIRAVLGNNFLRVFQDVLSQ